MDDIALKSEHFEQISELEIEENLPSENKHSQVSEPDEIPSSLSPSPSELNCECHLCGKTFARRQDATLDSVKTIILLCS